jgi:hypothetical protein
MPYDDCLRLHFHFCLRMYISSPPPGVQTYTLYEIENLQDDAGMYERDASLPELDDMILFGIRGIRLLGERSFDPL